MGKKAEQKVHKLRHELESVRGALGVLNAQLWKERVARRALEVRLDRIEATVAQFAEWMERLED